MSSVMEATSTSTTSTPTVIDVEAMLAPISDDNPSGESLQYSGVYDEIREARRAEEALEQGEWKRDTKVADWIKVASLATDALTQTKDLQIGAWLTEALIKLYGFTGLRDGLAVMRGMHELFWDTLYPENDEGDLEARANSLSFMDRQAALAIKEVALTKTSGGLNYSYTNWEESNQFKVGPEVDSETASAIRERAAAENKITSEDWLKAKQATPRSFYETIYAVLNESWETFLALDRVMDEKFGRQTPGLGALKKSLDEVRSLVERLVKEKLALEPDPISDAAGAATVDTTQSGADGDGFALAAGGVGVAGAAGPLRTRQEALNRLAEVAAYFRRTEPHNPVSYLVERAIKWSQMPLEAWLASVIKDGVVLDNLRETLGVDGEGHVASEEVESDE